MAESRRRHLAAIMFTDITGYTALLGDDEEAARQVRERHRTTIEGAVGAHGGDLVNRMGDGTVTIFASATEAVAAAVEIQRAFQTYPKIPVRIGIHLGEVAYDEEGAYGDAVNVASRINTIAPPGSVLVSEAIQSQLENQPRLSAVELGAVPLKNVRHPVRLFAIAGERLAIPTLEELTARAERAGLERLERPAGRSSGTPSIAVLPFVNMSADPENEYFCDGLAEDLITALSKLDRLRVVARTSAFAFKGREADVRDIGRTLRVGTVLEGGVRKSGNRLRITTQLIDVESGFHLWSERYDREMADIFDIQDEITLEVVDALKLKLLGDEKAAVLKHSTQNTEAYELYKKGRYHWLRATPQEFWAESFERLDALLQEMVAHDALPHEPHLKKSREYFLKAIELDPTYALGYQGLGEYYGFASAIGLMRPDEGWPKAEAALTKALELDDTLPEVHHGLAALNFFCYRDWQAGEAEVARVMELDPNMAEIHALYSVYLVARGLFDRAIAEAERALEQDPLSPRYRAVLGWWLYFSHRYDEAIEQLEHAIELDPTYPATPEFLGEAYALKGLHDEAVAAWKKAMSVTGDHELAGILEEAYERDGFDAAVRAVSAKRLERMAARQARGEWVPALELARAHTRFGDRDRAFLWLARAVEERTSLALLIGVDPAYDELRDDPRFQEVVARLGLPS